LFNKEEGLYVFNPFPFLVMACGPVDRRANRAEPARAKKSPHGLARAGSARPAGRAFHGGPAGLEKNTKFKK
jgi:hypothetical protein